LLFQWGPVENVRGELHVVETMADITASKSQER
jgi:hypothetical protein